MNWLWFDIDTQNDFMLPNGALVVPGAHAIIPDLARLVERSAAASLPLVSSLDSHTPDDPEFADFPLHCVVGTPGHRKIPDTCRSGAVTLDDLKPDQVAEAVRSGKQIIVPKNTYDVFTNPRLDKVLTPAPERVAVFGVATDYCVRACALACRNRRIETFLVADAIAGDAPETTTKALDEMHNAGVEDVTTDQLLAMLDD